MAMYGKLEQDSSRRDPLTRAGIWLLDEDDDERFKIQSHIN